MAKSANYKLMIQKQLERYKKRETILIPPKKKTFLEEQTKHHFSNEVLNLKKEEELFTESTKIKRTVLFYKEGLKFKAPRYSFKDIKKTGKKCLFKNCETLTENYNGFCLRHSKATGKGYKYKVRVPNSKPQILPTLKDFKKRLKRH